MSHRPITRREFLKSTALTAAAAMTETSLAHAVHDHAGQPDATPPSASRRITQWDYHAHDVGGIWEVWRGDKTGDRAVDLGWRPVELPHCFNGRDGVDPEHPYYQGPGWYRVRLALNNPYPHGRTLLHFEGAGQKSQVFLHLEDVGRHTGGYDGFVVDITEPATRFLNTSHNATEVPVAVRCDNSPDLETLPSGLSDFNRYGGLYRPVNLIYAPAISVERLHLESTVQPAGPAKVTVKARLYNPGGLQDDLQIVLRVTGPDGATVFTHSQALPAWQGEQVLAVFAVEAPALWSPAHPRLYRCEVTLNGPAGSMTVAERFGLRHFEFTPHGPFKLNGERLLLRGTHRHEDHAGVGAAMTDEMIRREMYLIKDMGANFIRLGHYQQSRLVLDLCDELGLLVWEEIPWCRGGLGGERHKQQVHDMLRAMIDQHYNHPAVIVWGLGDELDWPGDFPEFDAGKIRAFVTELNHEAHALDATRVTGLRRCEFCNDIPDVYSPSIWMGWLYGDYHDYSNTCRKEMEKVNRFLHLEWGGESHARRHSEEADRQLLAAHDQTGAGFSLPGPLPSGIKGSPSRDGDGSETYICNLFDWHLREQENMPWLAGAAQWSFKDFATPYRSDNPVPHVNQKGLVERDLTPKEGFFVFQSWWATKPMAHIYGHSWPVRWGGADELKMVKVYSNCQSAELFLNGVSCGTKQRNGQDFPAAGLRWLLKFKAGENHLRVAARQNGLTVTDEIRFIYQTTPWEKPARLELRKLARQGETVTVEVRLLDRQGTLCLDARSRVHFGITGSGTLLDNRGTSTGSRSVELYNGRAAISFNSSGGPSVVSVGLASPSSGVAAGVSPGTTVFLKID
ncbi:MAG: glycoside hydrolase family 2 protein [Acidobacteriia bacterium]|nr:glycoside hydrolase family 2 protein [Terriglobia bacterium]